MKKVKLLSSVVAVVLVIGLLSTTAFAASFNTTTTYDSNGDANVTTTVSGLTEADKGGQITYIAYKNGEINSDTVLYINQKEVAAAGELAFSYKVKANKFAGATATTIGLGTDKVAEFAPQALEIGKCTVSAAACENGTIDVATSELYPKNAVAVTVTPAAYYELDKFYVNGVETEFVGTTQNITITEDTTFSATFKAVDVKLDDELAEDDTTSFPEINTVSAGSFDFGGEIVNVPGGVIDVKYVVGKVIGNPAGKEFGMRVTYANGETQDFKALDVNADGTFAVRLIDVSEDQTALDDVVSYVRYIK